MEDGEEKIKEKDDKQAGDEISIMGREIGMGHNKWKWSKKREVTFTDGREKIIDHVIGGRGHGKELRDYKWRTN